MLKVNNLKVWFPIRKGLFSKTVGHVKAVDGVSIEIHPNSIFSLVGESGSGKSTLGNAVLGLNEISSGQVFWDEQEFFTNGVKPPREQRRRFQMIYQDSHSSLNPRKTIFETLAQPMLYHGICHQKEVKDRVANLLEMVQLEPDMMKRFPFAFSGGQRQRINIARTLGVEPDFIVCDEIVSALDVSVQAQILELIQNLKDRLKLSLLFIGHDLAVVKNISDYVAVMNQGKIVEEGIPTDIFYQPQHKYTQQLISAVPSLDPALRKRIS
jgi:ABC-type oligopeptide transport system ATPase subunit